MAITFSPKLSEFNRIEETILLSRLEAIRSLISHSGEKGRSLEEEVRRLLRDVLPEAYGIGTGFIAYSKDDSVNISKQLDIIIYDALRGGPIAKLLTADVYPLESVYAYIEVKAVIRSSDASPSPDNSIEKCLQDNRTLRSMRTRHYFKTDGPNSALAITHSDWMPIRAYLFAFDATGDTALDPHLLAQRLSDQKALLLGETHLHGLLIATRAYFETQPVSQTHEIRYTKEHTLSTFKWSLLHSLSRFPRMPQDYTPRLEVYSQLPQWATVSAHTP